ncbi:hypothetical protein KKH65_05095 [bacterium]|nr:hypothetical protein [bacterium]
MTDECEFFDTTEEGNFICKKIGGSYKEVTKEMCRTLCPVGIGKKRCEHLKFTLRKEQSFSALGVGGRKTQIMFERAVCIKLEEQIFDMKKCEACPNFRQATTKEKEEEGVSSELAKDELIQKGIKLLIDGLGREGALQFIKKMKITSFSDLPPQPKKEQEKPLEKKEDKKEEDELSLDKWLPTDF